MSAETLEFKAELKQLLHLITHSLYSDRDIFLRELVSNAADAINKVRFDSLSNDDALEGNKDWKIKLAADKDAGTLTLSDNGVGMSRAEVIDHLGTIAKSGTKAFVEAVKAKTGAPSPDLIGQFGVGFYSAFMVADTVTVHTRPAGDASLGVKWTSDGQGSYSIEPADKPTRGTDVILHLKEDAKEYLDPWRLRQLVKKYSDFIEHPVVMDEEKDGATTEVTLNDRKAIWLRAKSEVTADEYDAFYRQLSHDTRPPAKTLHFSVEGKTEFRALLFLPAQRPMSMDWEEQKAGLRLYVQRVLIMDRCEAVLPPYLRFVKGVVDSADLPLNVSRELLQQNPHLETIQKNLVRNVLGGLDGMKNTEFDKYLAFYRGLGSVLKEGLSRDWSNREKIADLLLFETAAGEADKFTTLAEYVEKIPAGQADIYYLIGDTAARLRRSPYLEAVRAKGYDVLLLTDAIDEFVFPSFGEYKGKKLVAVDRDEATTDDVLPETKDLFASLLGAMKSQLTEVADVRLTKRLTDSAACLVADGPAMTAHMERLMRSLGENFAGNKRTLELNPTHPAVMTLNDLHRRSPDDPKVSLYAHLLYDQAVIAEGSKVADPAAFAARVNELIR